MAARLRIVVTGGGGMLGSEVVLAGERAGHEVLGLTRNQLDIRDSSAVEGALAGERPDAVVNCAAYTNVDGAESDRDNALAVNVEGARNIACAAAAVSASVIYPSTDYVFAGDQSRPYVESDQTGPRSVYGESKLAGEQATTAAASRHQIIRTSWLFGLSGGNFVDTMLSLGAEREELNVVDDQVGCPTYSPHLAAAIVALIEKDSVGIRHLAGSGKASWYEFALEIFRQSGSSCVVHPCTTDEFPRPAPRPAHSVLESERQDTPRLPDWHEALAEYLTSRASLR